MQLTSTPSYYRTFHLQSQPHLVTVFTYILKHKKTDFGVLSRINLFIFPYWKSFDSIGKAEIGDFLGIDCGWFLQMIDFLQYINEKNYKFIIGWIRLRILRFAIVEDNKTVL